MSSLQQFLVNRRQFLNYGGSMAGLMAVSDLSGPAAFGDALSSQFVPRAKHVIWLTQAGAPSQLELFDHKPELQKHFNQDLPESVRKGQRLTGMTSGQARLPIAPSIYRFRPFGESGTWLSELLPNLGRVADRLCVVKTLHTEAINHDPAMTLLQTGHQTAGRPSAGAWLSYGLGSENSNLPAFVVMISRPSGPTNAQPLHERMWGSGFLPPRYQGVRFSPGASPVLYLANPDGITSQRRRAMLDDVAALNRIHLEQVGDPEISARIDQYEMAYRMQASVPELADLSDESESVIDRYGPEARKPGTFAANCILARRLVERGVRFVQLYHRGWDQHGNLPSGIKSQCYDTDQPSAALIEDLEARGLLEETLVVWGGEFGRTVYSQGTLTSTDYGRDHHPLCYSMWLAGAGIRCGVSYGETDEFSYNIIRDPVHIHDLNATILHLMGLDHTKLTFRHQGRDFRLTDIHGSIVNAILS